MSFLTHGQWFVILALESYPHFCPLMIAHQIYYANIWSEFLWIMWWDLQYAFKSGGVQTAFPWFS